MAAKSLFLLDSRCFFTALGRRVRLCSRNDVRRHLGGLLDHLGLFGLRLLALAAAFESDVDSAEALL